MQSKIHLPDDPSIAALIRRELRTDIGAGDVTTKSLVHARAVSSARIVAREACIAAGGPWTKMVFQALEKRLQITEKIPDGTEVKPGGVLMEIKGSARAILSAERTALNLYQRLSGIATLTYQFSQRAGRPDLLILDTRKTTPGLRIMEKYAVVCGGGSNHRMGLFDRVLIKDNHLAFWHKANPGKTVADAVRAARTANPGLLIEVEVDRADQLRDALDAEPDWVLLDNMDLVRLSECVTLCRGKAKTEASGGINLETIQAIAATGVDAVSIGALTHSARAVDLSLEMENP